jgi:uncharacterized NAD-dependent epimerase/dehydratase family protein
MSSQSLPFIPRDTPILIYSQGCFGALPGKTAAGVLRYGEWPVLAVIDSTCAGKTVFEQLKFPHLAPIVRNLEEAWQLAPTAKALLLGTAPAGGALDEGARAAVLAAIKSGLHIINGLHTLLNDDGEIRGAAQEFGTTIWDVRACPYHHGIVRLRPRPPAVRVVLTVGSDCATGKMTCGLELCRILRKRGERVSFVATGQTGIMIAGQGIPLDRAIGDFMAGATEHVIHQLIEAENPRWVVVEGQGSLVHPAYSSVTLALLHGSRPDMMVFCHNAGATHVRGYPTLPLPPLEAIIAHYESTAAFVKPAKVVGISLNTALLREDEAQAFIKRTSRKTGLPTTDCIRFGADILANHLMASS